MLTRLALIGSLLCPLAAFATCTVVNPSTQSINLIVGARCAGADNARPGLVVRAASSDAVAEAAPAPRDRRTNQEKLNAFNDLRHQSNYLAGKRVYYYGQKAK